MSAMVVGTAKNPPKKLSAEKATYKMAA